MKKESLFIAIIATSLVGVCSFEMGQYTYKPKTVEVQVERKINTPNPYYIFNYIQCPPKDSRILQATTYDLITLYDKGDYCFYPVIWALDLNGYPAIYKIIYQGHGPEERQLFTNYKLLDFDANKYDADILNAKYRRRSYNYFDHDTTNIVTANTDNFLKRIIYSSYYDIYTAALTHSTRINSNEIDTVVQSLIVAKMRDNMMDVSEINAKYLEQQLQQMKMEQGGK